jgi:hypothetical protein
MFHVKRFGPRLQGLPLAVAMWSQMWTYAYCVTLPGFGCAWRTANCHYWRDRASRRKPRAANHLLDGILSIVIPSFAKCAGGSIWVNMPPHSLSPPSFSIIACMERPTNWSWCAANRSNVRQRIHFGFSPPPFSMPGSHPSRARSLSARLVARPPASSRELA